MTLAAALVLAVLWPSTVRAKSRDEHRVLAAGQLVLGAFWRDRDQRRLSVDPYGQVTYLDARFRGPAYQARADLDLHAENTLSDRAIVDFTNRVTGEFDDPNDIQGSRYRWVDNRFRALWGIALDPETTMRTEAKLSTYQDVLFPELSSNTGELALTFDSELEKNRWLTFGFSGQGTTFDGGASPNYYEGSARLAYQVYSPRQFGYKAFPAPVNFPKPRETDEHFRYAGDLALHESKKLFPLGEESLIGRYIAPPLAVSQVDRLFSERVESEESFAGVEGQVIGRAYQTAQLSDFRRVEGAGFYQRRMGRGMVLRLSDAAGYLSYQKQDLVHLFADRADNRFKAELTRLRRDSRLSAYGSYGVYRFSDTTTLDLNSYELGFSSLYHFGRYWGFNDVGLTGMEPVQEHAGYPSATNLFWNGGFLVTLTPIQSLTVTGRYSKIDVPRFETLLTCSQEDWTAELRYHHRISKLIAAETGARYFDRTCPSQGDNNRHEIMVFLDTVLDL